MSWDTLVESMWPCVPDADDQQNILHPRPLLRSILDSKPAIHWFADSADSLNPLADDEPSDANAERLFPLMRSEQSRPILFWKTDEIQNFDWLGWGKFDWNYEWPRILNDQRSSTQWVEADIQEQTSERYSISTNNGRSIATVVVQIWLNNVAGGQQGRTENGNLYTVLVSYASKEHFLNHVIVAHQLPVHHIKVGESFF